MVDFGQSTGIKAALVMGQTQNIEMLNFVYSSEGTGWYLTFGNSASPCFNPTIYT